MEFDKEAQHVGEGWLPILETLHYKIMEIDPDYELLQIKEKFGGLRYYYTASDVRKDGLIEPLVEQAEAQCWRTCEMCGSPEGVASKSWTTPLGSSGGWIKTLCQKCGAIAIERRKNEEY